MARGRLQEFPGIHDRDTAEDAELLQVPVSRDHQIRSSLQGTFEDPIVWLVRADHVDRVLGLNELREPTDGVRDVVSSPGRPFEFPNQNAFDLCQDRRGDEELDLVGPGQSQHFVWDAAEVECRDVDIGVSDDTEH